MNVGWADVLILPASSRWVRGHPRSDTFAPAMSPTAPNPWIAFHAPRPKARLRLLCFPYAGGGALVYREWAAGLPEAIEVLPVQLPGRERRLAEPAFTRMEPLVEAASAALVPFLDRPFAIFGHSMGAAVGYEVAQRLRRERGVEPSHLLVSARRAPQLPPEPDDDYKLPDDQLIERLREINGTPAEVLEHPELMALMLPILRADFELNDTYLPAAQPPLACPITAFGGRDDEELTPGGLEAWSQATTGRFELRMFAGDHFYLNQHRGRLLEAVAGCLLS
jgi:surfactin synthase thioesterase subunit